MAAPTLLPRIAAGRRYSVGVLPSGTVVTAGPVGADGLDVSDWVDVVAVAAGNVHAAPNTGRSHTVGLLRGGTVRAGGWNGDGQCDVDSWTNVVGIAAGWRRTLGVRRVEIDPHPAATTDDLLDGLSRFRPHVVHFSGHSDELFIEFEADRDEPHESAVTSARAFANAIGAVDDPPSLVLLNSCNSARQADRLVESIAPLAIGMADEIDDGDAIAYAARFYGAIADGQSVQAAHQLARSQLELAGLSGADLPMLAAREGIDPAAVVLVKPEL